MVVTTGSFSVGKGLQSLFGDAVDVGFSFRVLGVDSRGRLCYLDCRENTSSA
jgi:hypothetical protein